MVPKMISSFVGKLATILVMIYIFLSGNLNAQFSISECAIIYGNEELALGQDTTAWFSILGTPSRRFVDENHAIWNFIWDDLGVRISTGELEDNRSLVHQVHFFFRTLDSKEGRKNEIGDIEVSDFRPFSKADARRILRNSPDHQFLVDFIRKKSNPLVYLYPLQKIESVMINGESVSRKSDMANLNSKFEKAGMPRFHYTGTSPFLGNSSIEDGISPYSDHFGYYTLKDKLDCNGNRWTTRAFLSRRKNLFHLAIRIYDW